MKPKDLFRFYHQMEISIVPNNIELTSRENLLTFELTEVIENVIDIEGLRELILQIQDFYRLRLSTFQSDSVHIYFWLDEMAGQLRTSLFIGEDKSALPFRRTPLVTEDHTEFATNLFRLALKNDADADADADAEPLVILWSKI
ncbi:MAG: hypothetical protein EOP04_14050 [Proteobacteria bacterium]|nr:MAG: hypothetical protein EOP04_14050 [Pseudomonadota bacterium]